MTKLKLCNNNEDRAYTRWELLTDKENHNRAKAMDFALAVAALYTEKYYEAVCKAIKNENGDEFRKIAKKAGISSEYAELLWDAINSGNIGLDW